jgi:hypothetical protein
MVRTLTSSATTEKNRATGSKPRFVVRIDWGGGIGTKYYADHSEQETIYILNTLGENVLNTIGEQITLPGLGVTTESRLMNVSDIESALSKKAIQTVGAVSINLSDNDGTLRGYCDTTPLELKTAVLYQHFVGNTYSDFVPLLVGVVDDPVRWSEDGASLSFDITDLITGVDITVGHLADVADFVSVPDATKGACLPLVFGKVTKSKAVQVSGGLSGFLLASVYADATVLYIEGGQNFPQATPVTITIFTETISGHFDGKVFTITSRPAPAFRLGAGEPVRLGSDTAVFVANDARSKAVNKVWALRRYTIGAGGDHERQEEELMEVPADRYTLNLNDTTTFPALGRALTTLAFATPLTALAGENWASDDVYVDIDGYTPDGTTLPENPADVIERLLVDFGGLSAAVIDTASFAAAETACGDRVFGFALSQQYDLRDLVADLTWQAGCAVMVIGEKIYLHAVTMAPGTSVTTLQATGQGGVDVDSIKRQLTEVKELWSEVTVKYKPDLSGLEENPTLQVSLKDATAAAAFGRRVEKQELDFWAYRYPGFAKQVAQDYLNAHARQWHKATIRTYLDTLELTPLDWVTLSGLPYWTTGQKARIESVRHMPTNEPDTPDTIEYELLLPIYPGCSGTDEALACQGAVEHVCASETGCLGACEGANCQTAGELICVTNAMLVAQSDEPNDDGSEEFSVVGPGSVDRGESFNLIITAVSANGNAETAYVPAGNVNLTDNDGNGDSISPSSTPNTGWSNGSKTVACTLTGGSGSGPVEITVTDPHTGRRGVITVTIGPIYMPPLYIATADEAGGEITGKPVASDFVTESGDELTFKVQT